VRLTRVFATVAAVVVTGCGGGQAAAPTPQPTSSAVPELARAPKRDGEIVIRGDLTPDSHGPYDFSGDYTVRFEQYAPEDPNTDFASMTTFVTTLDREKEIAAESSIPLFKAAARARTRRIRITGRYYVDASFGDYPYVIRFTPRG
jgi:hypothetical protein